MKNMMGKTRDSESPYMVFEANGWTWKVRKSWQGDDTKTGARWFCEVSSPFTYGGSDLGDTYVTDVVSHGRLTYIDPVLVAAGYTPPTAETAAPNPMDALFG